VQIQPAVADNRADRAVEFNERFRESQQEANHAPPIRDRDLLAASRSASAASFTAAKSAALRDSSIVIDYKTAHAADFITERGKIIPKRISGCCARHQRALTHAIKRARTIALLPFVGTIEQG
jgi:small subunit ribosomal protein S18